MVNQVQLSSGNNIQKFLPLSLHEFFPFLCNHIAFFHIEGQKEIHAQVKSNPVINILFPEDSRSGRVYQRYSRFFVVSLSLALFSRNSRTTLQILFPPPDTRRVGAWKEEKRFSHR